MTDHLETYVINEAISSIEIVGENLLIVESDVHRWKWIVIALHNALQNTMVSALHQGNGFNSMDNASQKKWSKAYEAKEQLPRTKLANFLDLYKRIKKEDIMKCFVHSRHFVSKQEHTRSVKKLNYIRNRFIHFELDVWSLEISGMPELCLHCMDVVGFLVLESGNVNIFKKEDSARLRKAISHVVEALQEIDTKYKNTT